MATQPPRLSLPQELATLQAISQPPRPTAATIQPLATPHTQPPATHPAMPTQPPQLTAATFHLPATLIQPPATPLTQPPATHPAMPTQQPATHPAMPTQPPLPTTATLHHTDMVPAT